MTTTNDNKKKYRTFGLTMLQLMIVLGILGIVLAIIFH